MTDTVAPDKGLSTMLLPELKALATKLGVDGATGMRKADLISAISTKQSSGGARRSAKREPGAPKGRAKADAAPEVTEAPAASGDSEGSDGDNERRGRNRDRNNRNDRGDRGDR
ncbi:MAG: Rho termination factor N-terminal domain-containing protein, partial [Actinomycetes bacterium]